MRIDTMNHGGRAIPRAARALFPQYLGYRLAAPGEPTLSVRLEGFDGKAYTVLLTDADCDAIAMARAKYAPEFAAAVGRQS